MRANSPKFEADLYGAARPLYPRDVFRLLERVLIRPVDSFVDLGCGTGLSTRSFLALGIATRGYAIDADPAMIEIARRNHGEGLPEVSYRAESAEQLSVESASVDLALVGSAIHWFDLPRARREIERVLRPDGILYVFEYQFPKCTDDPELAETVRRRFNLEWKAPVQTPRGTLRELVSPFCTDDAWIIVGDERPPWSETLTHAEFLGHLFSQSRYLHAESDQPNGPDYRHRVEESFLRFFERGPRRFDFLPRAIALKRCSLMREDFPC